MAETAQSEATATLNDRRSEIIATARSVLAEKGPGALTMRHIADLVGIKLASLQYHFPNKAALIEALSADVVAHYEEHLEQVATEHEEDPELYLAELIRWIRSEKDGEWRLIHRLEVQFWAMALTDETVAKAQVEFFAGYRELLADIIRRINPELTELQALQRGALMSVMIDGCCLIENDALPRDSVLSQLTDELIKTALELAKRPAEC